MFNSWNKSKQEKILKQEKGKQLQRQKQALKIEKHKQNNKKIQEKYNTYAKKHSQLECPHCGRKFPDKKLYYDSRNNEMVCTKCYVRWKATVSDGSNEQTLKKAV